MKKWCAVFVLIAFVCWMAGCKKESSQPEHLQTRVLRPVSVDNPYLDSLGKITDSISGNYMVSGTYEVDDLQGSHVTQVGPTTVTVTKIDDTTISVDGLAAIYSAQESNYRQYVYFGTTYYGIKNFAYYNSSDSIQYTNFEPGYSGGSSTGTTTLQGRKL